MLPDFLKIKEKLQKLLDYQMRQANLSHLGPLAKISVSMNFEGNRTVLIRGDGSVDEMQPKVASTEIEVKLAEAETMTPEMVNDMINNAAEEIAAQQAGIIYKKIDKYAEEDGTVVSSGGGPFSIDKYFELLEKIDIDFDEAGNPEGLAFVVNPKALPLIEDCLSKASANPENERRYKKIMDRKREEWRVRESNRKLVG